MNSNATPQPDNRARATPSDDETLVPNSGIESTSVIPVSRSQLLNKRAVCRLLAISMSTLHNWTSPQHRLYKPSFPKPIRLSTRAVRFGLADLLAWMANTRTASQAPWADRSEV